MWQQQQRKRATLLKGCSFYKSLFGTQTVHGSQQLYLQLQHCVLGPENGSLQANAGIRALPGCKCSIVE